MKNQIKEYENLVNSQRDKLTEMVNSLANLNDNYSFLKAENEAYKAQIETDKALHHQTNCHKIENLQINLENEMNNSLRLMQENQKLQTTIELINDENDQKLIQYDQRISEI